MESKILLGQDGVDNLLCCEKVDRAFQLMKSEVVLEDWSSFIRYSNPFYHLPCASLFCASASKWVPISSKPPRSREGLDRIRAPVGTEDFCVETCSSLIL